MNRIILHVAANEPGKSPSDSGHCPMPNAKTFSMCTVAWPGGGLAKKTCALARFWPNAKYSY